MGVRRLVARDLLCIAKILARIRDQAAMTGYDAVTASKFVSRGLAGLRVPSNRFCRFRVRNDRGVLKTRQERQQPHLDFCL